MYTYKDWELKTDGGVQVVLSHYPLEEGATYIFESYVNANRIGGTGSVSDCAFFKLQGCFKRENNIAVIKWIKPTEVLYKSHPQFNAELQVTGFNVKTWISSVNNMFVRWTVTDHIYKTLA